LLRDDGARCSAQEVRHLAGLRGFRARPSGEIIETPIKSNFGEARAINPRMRASWRIRCAEPRAPESDMIRIGFISLDDFSRSSMALNISLATLSVASDQMAMTLL